MSPESEQSPPSASRCPECGAAIDPADEQCWLCRANLKESKKVNPFEPPSLPRHDSSGQFSLSTLMLVITLVAVCLGALVAAPGLGILLILVAVPALIRTMVMGSKLRVEGHPLSTGEKTLAFLGSLGLMVAVGIAGVVAFQIACWGSCAAVAAVAGEGEGAFSTGLILGAAAGLGVIGYLFYLTLPKRPR